MQVVVNALLRRTQDSTSYSAYARTHTHLHIQHISMQPSSKEQSMFHLTQKRVMCDISFKAASIGQQTLHKTAFQLLPRSHLISSAEDASFIEAVFRSFISLAYPCHSFAACSPCRLPLQTKKHEKRARGGFFEEREKKNNKRKEKNKKVTTLDAKRKKKKRGVGNTQKPIINISLFPVLK